jgi:folylpolyglutamate synthase/dihydropteroate synthase
MVLTCLSNFGFDKKIIQEGLNNIYNPGRFEWLSPDLLVDTANNTENIKILAKMAKRIIDYPLSTMTVIF